MAKKQRRHTRLQRQAAGRKGKTEKKQPGGTRLDALKLGRATEVERSGRMQKALQRLAKERGVARVLKVPQKDFNKAVEAAQQAGIKTTITNLSGTRKKTVNA